MVQYINWVGGVLRGNFGTSIRYNEDVGKLMLERFPVTLLLGVLALTISTTFGITAGVLSAYQSFGVRAYRVTNENW
jgi:peptide/nickel transport system permease protein